ncbi:hypothetical protein [Actinophytocola sediminis]
MMITATETTTKPLLRFALTFDGVVTGVTGVALAALAGVLAGPLGLPAAVLLGTGLFFVGYGAAVLYLGTRPTINRRGALAVVVINLISVLDSVLVAMLGGLTTLGVVVLVVLAVAVAALAGLQLVGLRRN